MKVILISGRAEHGKDLTAQMIKHSLEIQDKKVLICHYADLLKYICKTFFGWNGEKDKHGRELLQKIGTDKVREVDANFWVGFIAKIISIFHDEWDYVLIPDARFPNEIEVMKNVFDTKTVRVIRKKFESKLTKEQMQHPSEIVLDNYKFDYMLLNDGTKHGLYNAVQQFLESEIFDEVAHGL